MGLERPAMNQTPQSFRLKLTVLILSLLSPFVVLSLGLTPWSDSWRVTRIWQEFAYPFEYAWHASTKSIKSTWSNYVDISNAAKENQELKRRVTLLEARIMDYDEQVQETQRLRELLGFTQRFQRQHLVGEVLGASPSLPYRTVRVSQGEKSGVQVGMPVVTASGIVGRVLRSAPYFSDVQLITDGNFSVDVLLQRTRVRGVLQGHAGHTCQLRLNRRAEIRIGDTVITSGIVGAFPKGLPVGRVTRISYEADNISQVITVEPWVDHQRLEEVIILREIDKDMQKIIETAGNQWLERNIAGSAR